MIKLSVFSILLIIGVSSFGQKAVSSVQVKNLSAYPIVDRLISLNWDSLDIHVADTSNVVAISRQSNKELPIQWFGDSGRIIECLVLLSLPAKSHIDIDFKIGKRSALPSLTYGRLVPERFDDFAWENNRIAFRTYGKALEATKENAYGFDVWVKKTERMIIDKWYKGADYHKDHGEGLDYYSVGYTLGAGNIAPYAAEKIIYTPNFYRSVVIANGPLRTVFDLEYSPFSVGASVISCKKRITIDAGSQLSKVKFTFNVIGEFDSLFCIGLTRRNLPGQVYVNETSGILTYWEPEDQINGVTGTTLLLNRPVQYFSDVKHHLFIVKAKSNVIEYYMGAAWNKAQLIKNFNEWNNYVNNFALTNNDVIHLLYHKRN